MAAVPPPAKAAIPAANTNLNTFSTGVFGTKFKKGDTWVVGPADWTNNKFDIDPSRTIDGKDDLYKDITYMNYDLATLEAEGFPQDSIATLADKYKIGKTARIYAKKGPELNKMILEFQKAVDTHRTAQLKPMLAKKKAANQKEWNTMTSGISEQAKAELEALTQVYLKKKEALEKELEAAFKAQKKQLIINKQLDTKDKYEKEYLKISRLSKPGVKKPEGNRGGINLSGALDEVGRPIINSIKVGQTRKRHRFIHLLVKPGTQVNPPVWHGDGNGPTSVSTHSENDDPWSKVTDHNPSALSKLAPGAYSQPRLWDESPPSSPRSDSGQGGGKNRKTKRKPRLASHK